VIPLRDRNPTRSFAALTYLLIALNAVVFLYQVSLSDVASGAFVERFGMLPYALTALHHPGSSITPLTSMFMHGGWLHLIFNMWSLHIFGDNIEDALGTVRFLIFYIVCGLAAAAAQVLIDPASTVPMVGASGAIAGVLGAYLRLYPRARIVTLIPIFIFMLVRELPATVFIVLWFLIQLVGGVESLASLGDQTGGVAFFAHIGGFVAGLFLIGSLGPTRNRTRGFQSPYAHR